MATTKTTDASSAAPSQEVPRTGSITVLVPDANLDQDANYSDSKRIAVQNGGRLVTLKEFITQLKSDPDLLKKARHGWYWLGGEPGLEIEGYCKIDYEKGSIVPISKRKWDKLSPQDKAYTHKGTGPLALLVYGAENCNSSLQLSVFADVKLEAIASRVAYVAVEEDAQKSGSTNAELRKFARKE